MVFVGMGWIGSGTAGWLGRLHPGREMELPDLVLLLNGPAFLVEKERGCVALLPASGEYEASG